MIRSLDKEADRLGLTRQSIIKGWMANVCTRPPWNHFDPLHIEGNGCAELIPFPLRLKPLA